jgi:sulfite reductase (ferredoxin)
MQSFRSELENPIVERDILDLEKRIRLFREGKINDEKFRSLRLARGIYGQRQPGVQMVRIKLPYGKLNTRQLDRICNVSDEYATGNLHITTRQDIQIHFVSLDRTPELWEELQRDDVTIREACGNTVRNITASPMAGIDPDEPFDVSPYARAFFKYFLRNPVCQEMGRKFKIAFSSSEADTAYAYMHDLGFIPRITVENGVEKRGFRVVLGGGLGSQPHISEPVTEFMHEDLIIPFAEATMRIFDRYGERVKRHKARMKYLIQDIGLQEFLRRAEAERLALKHQTYRIPREAEAALPEVKKFLVQPVDTAWYEQWLKTNVFPQKQEGFYAVGLRVQNGDIKTPIARKLANLIRSMASDDIRLTTSQGVLLRFVHADNLPFVFNELHTLKLAAPGFESTVDITSCPGTDTCNLGISNSTGITRELERIILDEYPDMIYNKDIHIKISGCINACGQHALASIGFHGSSMKVGKLVAPALQVLLGGGGTGSGSGNASDKVIKVPSRRGPQVLRLLLDDFAENAFDEEPFNTYYRRQGKIYFYDLLNPLASQENLTEQDFIDWEQEKPYTPAIGIGECAGVMIDLVATLLADGEEKAQLAEEAHANGEYADAIYYTYTSFINIAKAMLTSEEVKTNTQSGIINDFNEVFVNSGKIALAVPFNELVYQLNTQEPSQEFSAYYLGQAKLFREKAVDYRTAQFADVVS